MSFRHMIHSFVAQWGDGLACATRSTSGMLRCMFGEMELCTEFLSCPLFGGPVRGGHFSSSNFLPAWENMLLICVWTFWSMFMKKGKHENGKEHEKKT